MTSPAVLGVDVGGTSIKARCVRDGEVLGEWRTPTPRNDPSAARTISAVASLAAAAGDVAAVGVVVPGIVDDDAGVCIEAVNLGWRAVQVRDALVEAIGLPIAFGHDVRAGALAEWHAGIPAGFRRVVAFVPIGTGVSSALVIDGVPATRREWPGEFGQDILTSGPWKGLRVEEVASASAIARRAGAADALIVAQRVRWGDRVAQRIWSDAISVLADSLAGLVRDARPDTLIMGGGLAGAGREFFDPLKAALADRIDPLALPRVVRAAHGDASAIVGAALMAESLLESR